MTRYRQIPEEIDAWRFDGTAEFGPPVRVSDTGWAMPGEIVFAHETAFVGTRSGVIAVLAGDWIIRDANGDYSAMDHRSFTRVYERIEVTRTLPHAEVEAALRDLIAAGPGPVISTTTEDNGFVTIHPQPRRETMPQTKGEYRVGISFNPSGSDLVSQIKRGAADLIDLIETVEATDGGTAREIEILRLKALAQTEIESAAMWAVKAATKGEWSPDNP